MPRAWYNLQHPQASEVAVGLALLTPPKLFLNLAIVIPDT